ncbi:JAB domain-containing protein [Thalassotalea psychrophila]|uniref:JAB domain-containing protein n=1 Tax=Thalassotalea psychrophila TaxID=3065647 RepID=A0ABY9TUQ5_9GAMM|nr:JAB domain-containing protein [Colwelliaceae bacterium SQ149]
MPILRELEVRYRFVEVDCEVTGSVLNSPEKIHQIFHFLKYEPKEKLIVVNLNNKNAIMNYEVVATGKVNGVNARAAEVLKTAVLVNANAVILIHNHPSGSSEPSKEDKRFTLRVLNACKALNITLLDHIIIGEQGFYSLKEGC